MRENIARLFVCALIMILPGCRSDHAGESGLFELVSNSGIDFSNDITNDPDFNIFSYRNFYNGGGVAIGDLNNDGLPDIFFTSNMKENKLYLNKGNFKFDDISDRAGLLKKGKWGTGVTMADINGDGYLDIYVCYAGYQKGIEQKNELYINNGDLTFTESAASYGLDDGGYSTHAAFFDYDMDGDLDVYILNNSFIPVNTLNYANKRNLRAEDWPVADFLKGGGDKLLRNDNGKFADVSEEAGIYGSLIGFGLGVTVGDVNSDGYPDMYISNDFFERDYLYINQKNGKFSEELEQWVQHISLSSMGADIADVNNDGYPDIFTTDMLPVDESRLKTTATFENIDVYRLTLRQGFYHQYMQNTLQVNNRAGKFLETAHFSGVAASDWSWGGLFFDADNDGLSDLFVCNGIAHDVTDQDFIDFFANDVVQKMVLTGRKDEVDDIISKMPSRPIPNMAFRNQGNLKFADVAGVWGLGTPSFSNGAAYGDLDNDGDLDLVVNNLNSQAFVYRNTARETTGNHYLGVRLKGKDKNKFAIGASIKLYQGNQIISREIMPSRGFQSSVDYTSVIGVGKTSIDSLVIRWPNNTTSSYTSLSLDSVYTFEQIDVQPFQVVPENETDQRIADSIPVMFSKHTEDDYVDFYYERNLPALLSREGPKAAIADVNGDGLVDMYIGGAAKQAGQLYIQTASGFVSKSQNVFEQFAEAEDEAVSFFDCDNDGDQDLIIGSGGNHLEPGNGLMQNRLYINDGKGNFELSPSKLPLVQGNTSVILPEDVDKDGDADLFIGSRTVPKDYGTLPRSYLWINDGKGNFTNAAIPALLSLGLVKSGTWADMNNDGNRELVIVGEWMSPRIFTVSANAMKEIPTDLDNLSGLWQTVTVADLDGDGDMDLVLGNLGENFYLKPQKDEPVKLWINDFDNNRTTDKILTRTINGKDLPVFMKRDITDQIPTLKKNNLTHSAFAENSVQQLFSPELIKGSQVRELNYSSSCLAINEGNGKFSIRKLPLPVQLSCINSSLIVDINNDGFPDIVMGGNNHGFMPQFSRLDASFGHVLINDGKGNFSYIPNQKSGIEVEGVIRDIKLIRGKQNSKLVFLRNNELPSVFTLRNLRAN